MNKNITEYPNLKQIEQMVWRQLQETFSTVIKKLLEDIDRQIAEERDKKRYRLLDKRTFRINSLFGEMEVNRNYYRDRVTGEYVYLLDRYLEFEGAGSFSPLMEEAAIELAVKGPSYRKAAHTLETLLGYRVISHEAIRQHLLQVSSIPKKREPVYQSRNHPRYRQMQKALASYDGEKLLTELNSVVGTLEDETQEERLEAFIRQLEKYPEALGDYREWLKEQGMDTTGMRPMGSAEGTMSVFAKRLKNGRSWVENGLNAMFTGLVAYLDHLALKTLFGRVERWTESKEEKNPPKHYVEKVTSTVGEATRDNLLYLKGKANTPIYKALKALTGF